MLRLYFKVMGLIVILAKAVGIFWPQQFEIFQLDLIGELVVSGNFGDATPAQTYELLGRSYTIPSLNVRGHHPTDVLIAKLWNFSIRSILGMALIGFGFALDSLVAIENRIRKRGSSAPVAAQPTQPQKRGVFDDEEFHPRQ
jgi:hypothetical protein